MGSSYQKQAVGDWFAGDGDNVVVVVVETGVGVLELFESSDDKKRHPPVRIMSVTITRTITPHLIPSH